jgi:toxin ParE1/3/4
MTVKVTPRAAADLEAIARWTLRNWGADRMAGYLRALSQRFDWLAQNPQRGRDRSDVGVGYRSFPEGRHMIFYLVIPEGIAIIGVPHQAMDAGSHFDGEP